MYYQNYEDYMRSVLGYGSNNQDMYTYDNNCCYETPQVANDMPEELYPDMYKIVYPMVCKVCEENATKPLTQNLLNEMTEVVYKNVEVDVNIELGAKIQTSTTMKNSMERDTRDSKSLKEPERETRHNNNYLRDLIKLIILGIRPGWRPPMPPRPPFPPMPPRPPFPGGPGGGFPPPRPPMLPPRPPFPGGPGMPPPPQPRPRDY